MAKSSSKKAAPAIKTSTPSASSGDDRIHLLKTGFRCDTECRGHKTPKRMSKAEIVVDASEGFIPLWAKNTILRWCFRESSFTGPKAASTKQAAEKLFSDALIAWGDAAPVKFSKNNDLWDFEIVMKSADDCANGGCVLASAFFPDAGRHQLFLYPKMFEQSAAEQIDTLTHELGHVFGLRHFFALVKEQAWPAEIFGTHDKFSIMNYGDLSKLTPTDRADLKQLYASAWSGQLTEINGTPIRFVKPYHESGLPAQPAVAIAAFQTM